MTCLRSGSRHEWEQNPRAAGWHPGRAVDVTDWRERLEASGEVRIHRAAAEFLVELGGLNVEIGGPGISSAREPFELDLVAPRWSSSSV